MTVACSRGACLRWHSFVALAANYQQPWPVAFGREGDAMAGRRTTGAAPGLGELPDELLVAVMDKLKLVER